MSQERVLGLLKFGKRAHIEDFIREGHLYMNTLSYFAGLENEMLRGDKDEGSTFCMQSDKAKLSIEIDGEFKEIPGIVGPILIREDANLTANVFCMYAVHDNQGTILVDPQNLGFGDTYALLTKGDEFLRRVRVAAEKTGKDLQWNLVTYVGRDTYDGRMGIFRKFSMFSYQSEFRVALSPSDGSPYSLRIGDLSDIAVIGKLAQINEDLRIVGGRLGFRSTMQHHLVS